MNSAIQYEVGNPYPGLRPFRVDEKHLFFGREEQVDRMVEKLEAHRFLAVVGGSGSGKSSLVNCGLRPALHRGNMASAGANWKIIQIRPGSDPFGALAQALAEPDLLFSGHTSSVVSLLELVSTTLRVGSLGLVDLIDQADLPVGTKVLVVVDQFEELFRFRSLIFGGRTDHFNSGEDAVAFVRLLLEAITQTSVPIYIVITMRSDFLGECAQFRGLPEAINESQYLVPRLSRNEIRAAVTGPAALRGVTLSPVLLARLLNDVGDHPDQLSILQHALNRTWAYMEKSNDKRDMLELYHYEAAGGMEQALDQHAEKVFGELTNADDQRLCEKIFKVLTDVGTDARGVRRPTQLATLGEITGAPEQKLAEVINVFRKPSRSFLMPPFGETLEPQTPIDISHESLMRVWKRLKNWADDEAQSARNFCRLRDAAEDYQIFQGNELRGSQLRFVRSWYEKNKPTSAWAELYGGGYEKAIAFLDASSKKEDEENYKASFEARWNAWKRLIDSAIAIMSLVLFFFLKSLIEEVNSYSIVHIVDNFITTISTDSSNRVEMNNISNGFDIVSVSEWIIYYLAPAWVLILILMLSLMFSVVAHILLVYFAKYYFSKWDRWWYLKATDEASLIFSWRMPKVDVESHGYASVWRRASAELIDWVACFFGAYAIVFLVAIAAIYMKPSDDMRIYLLFIPAALFFGLYHIIFWVSKWQATPGMRSLGIIITSKTGHRLGLWSATIRFFARWLSYCTLMIGFLMALFNKKNQTLHDKIANTMVVHCRAKLPDMGAATERVK